MLRLNVGTMARLQECKEQGSSRIGRWQDQLASCSLGRFSPLVGVGAMYCAELARST